MLNYIVMQGRLGSDPDKRETNSGKTVATVNIGCQRAGTGTPTDWVRITCWDKTADLLTNYFHKGDEVLVEGRLQISSYEKDGQKKSYPEISVSRINFTSGRKSRSEEKDAGPVKLEELNDDGTLPF